MSFPGIGNFLEVCGENSLNDERLFIGIVANVYVWRRNTLLILEKVSETYKVSLFSLYTKIKNCDVFIK